MDYTQLSLQMNIGNTLLTRCVWENNQTNIFAKQEQYNASGSIKDRAALNMIVQAVNSGRLTAGGTIVEATSGNTGIALAYIGRQLGYKVVLTMPSSMSQERRQMLTDLGAQLVLVEGVGMQPSIDLASRIASTTDNCIEVRQFENIANTEAHRQSTAVEILRQTNGKIDIFVASVGTGGTLTGIGSALRQYNKKIKIIAVEPTESAVISDSPKGAHGIQGIGAGFVPQLLDKSIIDRIITVSTVEALDTWRQLNASGYKVGISSGANMHACLQISREYPDANIVTVFADSVNRYESLLLTHIAE